MLIRVLFLLFLSVPAANAALIQYSGTSTANYSSGPLSSISTDWSAAVFDDSVVSGAGTEFFDVDLLSFVMSPNPIGSTIFDTSNTKFQLHYMDGDLFALRVGGIVNGVQGIGAGVDDFMARYTAEGQAFQTVYRLATSSAIDGNSFDMTATLNVSTPSDVPVPATLPLLGLGLAGLGWMRRKK